jgi:hypothetical protein
VSCRQKGPPPADSFRGGLAPDHRDALRALVPEPPRRRRTQACRTACPSRARSDGVKCGKLVVGQRELDSALASAVTGALGGKVGVAPRVFLKKLVADVMDRVDQFADFDPRRNYALTLSAGELSAFEGLPGACRRKRATRRW